MQRDPLFCPRLNSPLEMPMYPRLISPPYLSKKQKMKYFLWTGRAGGWLPCVWVQWRSHTSGVRGVRTPCQESTKFFRKVQIFGM